MNYRMEKMTMQKINKNELSFADDVEKMRDFKELTKEEFLESYSYLTEEEYNATLEVVNSEKE